MFAKNKFVSYNREKEIDCEGKNKRTKGKQQKLSIKDPFGFIHPIQSLQSKRKLEFSTK
jgi:hypothetical protein